MAQGLRQSVPSIISCWYLLGTSQREAWHAQAMRPQQLAVFFRNNHFNVLFKRNGALMTLVTDQGYLHEQVSAAHPKAHASAPEGISVESSPWRTVLSRHAPDTPCGVLSLMATGRPPAFRVAQVARCEQQRWQGNGERV